MRELRRTFADLKAYLAAQRRRLACERVLGILLVLPFVIADGTSMEINFAHDVDNVLKQASQLNKPVLLDFSAAPM